MGPIIGMSPDKKAETPGMLEERAGLRGVCGGAGTLPEAECGAASPLATSLDRGSGGSEDEELTNLNWLHENLLQNFTLGGPGGAQPSASPLFDIEGDPGAPQNPSSSSSYSSSQRDLLKSKPPFSFSLLIYMAIEQSPSKRLPVKDIYGWILQHFPYFSSAPTGWKNSVRHNLSLNKCFRKVERSLGKVNGKGSLWCVDPEYRPNLIQALKKQHFPAAHTFCTPPASPPSASSPPRHHFLQGCSLKESDIDAATAMMLLNSAPGHHHANPCKRRHPTPCLFHFSVSTFSLLLSPFLSVTCLFHAFFLYCFYITRPASLAQHHSPSITRPASLAQHHSPSITRPASLAQHHSPSIYPPLVKHLSVSLYCLLCTLNITVEVLHSPVPSQTRLHIELSSCE
uniref:Forkhead box protein G1 n=1 Tax=Oncorhynchus tshawytscha TaxID=74940 RepID=A0A8C8G3E1_ONCTS